MLMDSGNYRLAESESQRVGDFWVESESDFYELLRVGFFFDSDVESESDFYELLRVGFFIRLGLRSSN